MTAYIIVLSPYGKLSHCVAHGSAITPCGRSCEYWPTVSPRGRDKGKYSPGCKRCKTAWERADAPHPDAGKWRCAVCDLRWKPRRVDKRSPPTCPQCRERNDAFPADDGGWERAAEERKAMEQAKRKEWP